MVVRFIFGAAFATLIKSLVTNIIMPPLGLLLRRIATNLSSCKKMWSLWEYHGLN